MFRSIRKRKKLYITLQVAIILLAAAILKFSGLFSHDTPTFTAGERLYRLYCSGCHGINGEGNANHPSVKKKSPQEITRAITSVKDMASLKALTEIEIDEIAVFLEK